MKPVIDPEGVEVSHLISACLPLGKNILEVGCGHGNLTFQYANLPHKIMAIDPQKSELLLTRDNKLTSEMNISFIGARGESLPFQSQLFDSVVFASSL